MSDVTVYRFEQMVSDRPVELVRAIVKTRKGDRLGEVTGAANLAARHSLNEGEEIYLPVSSAEFDPVVIGVHSVQVTWVVTKP